MNQPFATFLKRRLSHPAGMRMWVAVCLVCVVGSGCSTVFNKPVMSSTPPGLPWLAGFATPPVETTPPFDLTQIQPVRRSGAAPDDMLEITIWDLYEPGKPHTFPSRIDSQGQIVVPHLETLLVTGQSVQEIESKLSEAYRQQDILKQPRVLVRELSSAPIHAYVTGAVLRPGLINLPRDDASVFAALVAAGGLSRNAGLQIYVSDQSDGKSSGQVAASVPDSIPVTLVAGNSGLQLPAQDAPRTEPQEVQSKANALPADAGSVDPPLQQLTNHSGPLTVSPEGQATPAAASSGTTAAQRPLIEEAIATRPDRPSKTLTPAQPGRWYDLSVAVDRDALKQLVIRDGDVVTVRPAAPPVRITGAVAQPGSYRAPANDALGLHEAIQLAGGFGVSDMPMVVVLTRPATTEHGLERWTFRMGHGEKLPPSAPHVEPGDLVHVEPTAQARVQSLVGSLWPGH